jgi:hypothetical protein
MSCKKKIKDHLLICVVPIIITSLFVLLKLWTLPYVAQIMINSLCKLVKSAKVMIISLPWQRKQAIFSAVAGFCRGNSELHFRVACLTPSQKI